MAIFFIINLSSFTNSDFNVSINKYATFSFKDTRYDENTTKPITLMSRILSHTVKELFRAFSYKKSRKPLKTKAFGVVHWRP